MERKGKGKVLALSLGLAVLRIKAPHCMSVFGAPVEGTMLSSDSCTIVVGVCNTGSGSGIFRCGGGSANSSRQRSALIELFVRGST